MHTYWVRSPRVCNITHDIDLSGISIMIFGSAYGVVHYVFACDGFAYYLYSTIQVLAIICILVSINVKLMHALDSIKAFLFIAQGAVGTIAVLHWKIVQGD